MKSKRNFKRNKITKNNRNKTIGGGFFSSSNQVYPSVQCDMNQLTQLTNTTDMHSKYQMCCPKGMFGTKNSSPYCKQLDLNFQAALKRENNLYQSNMYSNVPIAQLSQTEYNVASAQKKPWYQFWGGKKSRRKNSKKYRGSRKKI